MNMRNAHRVVAAAGGVVCQPNNSPLTNQAWVEGVTSGAYRQWVGKHYGG